MWYIPLVSRILLGLGFCLFLVSSALGTSSPSGPKVYHLTIDDQIIGPVVSEYIEKGIEDAQNDGAEALIIELDTPGGLLNSTRTIVKDILGAEVPIVVYVGPKGARAGSAGVFITLAAHIAAMAPSTNIGAAHPVNVGGDSPGRQRDNEGLRELIRSLGKDKDKDDEKDDKKAKKSEPVEKSKSPMEDKVLNDTIAWVTAIANERGRNADWAIKAVRESASITDQEALKKKVINLVADNVPDLVIAINGYTVELNSGPKTIKTEGAAIVERPMTKRQELLSILINPNIAYILMMLGFYGLLFEITHPGSWIPGIAGMICLILAFYAFQTIPTNYAGLALILIAIVLFIAEAFVTSYGLLTLGGVISMFLGSLFLIDSPFELMQVSLTVILPIVLSTAFLAVFLVTIAVRAQRLRQTTGLEGFIGQTAVVDRDIDPEGKVFIDGEIWNATADTPIKKGQSVEIVAADGMNLKVKAKESES